MASGMRQVLSRSASTYRHLVRNNLINCWGSTHKGRESSAKLLGFSASLALCGFGGAHIIKNQDKTYFSNNNNNNGDDKISRLFNRDRNFEGIHRTNVKLKERVLIHANNRTNSDTNSLRIQKCTKSGEFSSISVPLMKYFGLITPVSCSSEDADVCNCQSCEAERKWTTSAPSSSRNAGNSCNVCDPKQNQKAPSQNQKGSQNKANSNCDPPPAAGAGDSKKISNKRCGSASQCSRASDPGIDIEALSKELGGLKQMDWSMETDLSHCLLIRQASQVSVDAVTRILTEAVSAYDDYHAEYRRVLDLLMGALESSRTACGTDVEVIECRIILIRSKVDEIKRKIQEVDMFFGSLEKLCHAAAETAFMSHAEYASIAMSERLQSMCMEVKRLREETKEKERDMLELQSLIIVETGKSLK